MHGKTGEPGRGRPIVRCSEVAEERGVCLQVLRTETPLWAGVVAAGRSSCDDWYKVPGGHVDLCNVLLPVRNIPSR